MTVPDESVLSYAILTVICYGGLILFGLKAAAEREERRKEGERSDW